MSHGGWVPVSWVPIHAPHNSERDPDAGGAVVVVVVVGSDVVVESGTMLVVVVGAAVVVVVESGAVVVVVGGSAVVVVDSGVVVESGIVVVESQSFVALQFGIPPMSARAVPANTAAIIAIVQNNAPPCTAARRIATRFWFSLLTRIRVGT
jgi:hypothetical protein